MSQSFTGIKVINGGTSSFIPSRVDDVGLTLKMLSQQTGDAFNVTNSSDTVLAKIDKLGNLTGVAGTFTGAVAIGGATNFLDNVINANAATLAPTVAQSGSIIYLNRAGGVVVTLPAPTIGTNYTFAVLTALTNNTLTYEIDTDAGTTFIAGALESVIDASATTKAFVANGTSHVKYACNGDTKGGAPGTYFTMTCITATQWFISGLNVGSGTLATPFA